MPSARRLSAGAASVLALLASGLGPAAPLRAAQNPPVAAAARSASTPSDHARELAIGVGSPPLTGTLTLPAGKGPFPAVVLVSGSGPNDEDETVGPDKPFLDIALGLASRGIASVRYDKRALDYPKSINPRTFTPYDEYVPDALAAIRLLQHEPLVSPKRIFVLGHSQGGTMAPLIAARAPGLAGVILLAASTEHIGEALLRQVRYLATLPGEIGANAAAELPQVAAIAAEISNVATLEKDSPATVLFGGVGPAYYIYDLRYNPVATARAISQPLLVLQGGRDYQVTLKNDFDVWKSGLRGRKSVVFEQFPLADHLFIDGTGPPSPADYQKPSHVDPRVIAAIASWMTRGPGSGGLSSH